jgi:hypothetical protein
MFRALFAHHQEALRMQQFCAYYVGWLLPRLHMQCLLMMSK